MADPQNPENEGEGSRTADERYRRGVEGTVRKGHVQEDADRALRAGNVSVAAVRSLSLLSTQVAGAKQPT